MRNTRRRRKYERSEDTIQACKSYIRHDGGIEPDDICEDISLDHLQEPGQKFYHTNVVVTQGQACQIERSTKSQSDSVLWMEERTKRITSSKVGGIAKMRPATKRAKKVEDMLYTRFSGSAATRYGMLMEEEPRKQYITDQQQHGHQGLVTELWISSANPWLAASPDGLVHDPNSQPTTGLLEIKNPHSARDITVREFASKTSSCLNVRDNGTCYLKHGHDFYYQIQCQLYCADKAWCDFVVRTNKDMHIERIYRAREWWTLQMAKCKKFYFSALLPELACPRYRKGGIREPENTV